MGISISAHALLVRAPSICSSVFLIIHLSSGSSGDLNTELLLSISMKTFIMSILDFVYPFVFLFTMKQTYYIIVHVSRGGTKNNRKIFFKNKSQNACFAYYLCTTFTLIESETLTHMENIKHIPKVLPKGTTIEQWERYAKDMERHESYYKANEPKKKDYGFDGKMWPDYESEKAFDKDYSEWHMNYSCFEPNKPGYYRANND